MLQIQESSMIQSWWLTSRKLWLPSRRHCFTLPIACKLRWELVDTSIGHQKRAGHDPDWRAFCQQLNMQLFCDRSHFASSLCEASMTPLNINQMTRWVNTKDSMLPPLFEVEPVRTNSFRRSMPAGLSPSCPLADLAHESGMPQQMSRSACSTCFG